MDNFLLEIGDDEWLLDASYTAKLPFPIAILNSKGKLLYTNNPSATVLYRLQASSPCQPQLVKEGEHIRVYRCTGGLSYLATHVCPQGADIYELLCQGAKLPSNQTYCCPAKTPEGVQECCQTAPLLSEQELLLRQQQLLQIAKTITTEFERKSERQLNQLQALLLRSVTKYPHRLTHTLLCNKLAETLVQLPGIVCAAAALVEPETGQIELLASQGILPPDLPFSAFCTGLASRVIYEGKTRVLEDPTTDPTIPLLVAEEIKAHIGQIACCPVQVQGKTVALLFAGCPSQASFDVVRMEALYSLAKLAALQFDRLRSQHKLLAQQRVRAATEQLYTAINAQTGLRSLLSVCVDLAVAMLDEEKIYIRLTPCSKTPRSSLWVERGIDQEIVDLLRQGQVPSQALATEFPLQLSHKTLGFLGIVPSNQALQVSDIEEVCRLLVVPLFCCLALTPQAEGKECRHYRITPSGAKQQIKEDSGQYLTKREQRVLTLAARGCTNKGIATALKITEKTAKVHISNIMRKLGASDRTSAVVKALHLGLINPTSVTDK